MVLHGERRADAEAERELLAEAEAEAAADGLCENAGECVVDRLAERVAAELAVAEGLVLSVGAAEAVGRRQRGVTLLAHAHAPSRLLLLRLPLAPP